MQKGAWRIPRRASTSKRIAPTLDCSRLPLTAYQAPRLSITDFGIQKRTAYALNQVLTGVADKRLQQDLNKASQQAVPKL
jgi:hypothetical protein